MICKKCYTNNEDGAKFCVGCGERLEEMNGTVQNSNPVNNVQTQSNNTQYSNPQNNNQYKNTQYNGPVPEYNNVSAIISIIVAFLCCGGMAGAIFGILSLIDGSKVKELVRQGDIEGANAKLKQAKKWNMIGWIIVGIGAALSVIFFFLSVFMGILADM